MLRKQPREVYSPNEDGDKHLGARGSRSRRFPHSGTDLGTAPARRWLRVTRSAHTMRTPLLRVPTCPHTMRGRLLRVPTSSHTMRRPLLRVPRYPHTMQSSVLRV